LTSCILGKWSGSLTLTGFTASVNLRYPCWDILLFLEPTILMS
jgi:hypothetical protein